MRALLALACAVIALARWVHWRNSPRTDDARIIFLWVWGLFGVWSVILLVNELSQL
jgi:hypothetical protein